MYAPSASLYYYFHILTLRCLSGGVGGVGGVGGGWGWGQDVVALDTCSGRNR